MRSVSLFPLFSFKSMRSINEKTQAKLFSLNWFPEHGLVAAGVAAEVALEEPLPAVGDNMGPEVVLELGDKVAQVAAQNLLRPDVCPPVLPQVGLGGRVVAALPAVVPIVLGELGALTIFLQSLLQILFKIVCPIAIFILVGNCDDLNVISLHGIMI